MARRKQGDDSFVWLLIFGAVGYGLYSYFTSSGASAQNANSSRLISQAGTGSAGQASNIVNPLEVPQSSVPPGTELQSVSN